MNFRYCPICSKELNLSGIYPVCTACNETYYRNSKPSASVLIVKGDKVLLARRSREPYKGTLDVIGGFLEYGEHPDVGAIREIKEETGLDIKLTKLLGIYMDKYSEDPVDGWSTLNIHYIGEIIGGEMEAGDDVASLHWLDIRTLDIKEGFKNTIEAVADLKKYWIHKKRWWLFR